MEPTRRNVLAWAARKPGMGKVKTYPCTECVLAAFFTENGGKVQETEEHRTLYVSKAGRSYSASVPSPEDGTEYGLAFDAVTDTSNRLWSDVCMALRSSLANTRTLEERES